MSCLPYHVYMHTTFENLHWAPLVNNNGDTLIGWRLRSTLPDVKFRLEIGVCCRKSGFLGILEILIGKFGWMDM